jgi:ribosomal protein S3
MSEKMDILDIYKDEEQKSLINRKKKLILNLKKIAKTLKQNETIDSFLQNRINSKKRFSSLNIDAKKNQLFVWICVKICGTIFFSFFLI